VYRRHVFQLSGGTAVAGLIVVTAADVVIALSKNVAGDAFTASGTKTVTGQFWYESA
jgi:hypothetical protein